MIILDVFSQEKWTRHETKRRAFESLFHETRKACSRGSRAHALCFLSLSVNQGRPVSSVSHRRRACGISLMVGRFRFDADSTGHASAFEEITGVALRHAITQRDYRVTLTDRRNLIGLLDRLWMEWRV